MLSSKKKYLLLFKLLGGIIIFIFTNSLSASANDMRDSLMKLFLKTQSERKIYDNEKLSRIAIINNSLKQADKSDFNKQFDLVVNLWNEFSPYQRDSSLKYAHKLNEIANKSHQIEKITEAKLKLAHILVSSGLFKEATDCLKSVVIVNANLTRKQEYYYLYAWLYISMAEYNEDAKYAPYYKQKEKEYRDSAVFLAESNNFLPEMWGKFADSTTTNKYKKYQYYLDYLQNVSKKYPHEAARLANTLSDIYPGNEKIDLLLISAINDIKASVKETQAAFKLGKEFNRLGDYNNSFIFLTEAMENAEFYGSRSHKVEISNILPYVATKKILAAEHRIFIVVLIAIVLVIIIIATLYSRTLLKSLNSKINRKNADLQNALTALEQSQEENKKMLKFVAHDLRGAMGASIGVANALLMNSNLNDDDKNLIELLKKSGDNSIEMISDLLATYNNLQDLHIELIELHSLIYDSANLLTYKAAEKHQKIEVEAEPTMFMANREKIWRLLSNLIINAIKFSPENTLIKIKLIKANNKIILSVKDNGIGIPPEMQEKIFNLNTSKNRAGTSGEQSFGLGLFITKQITEAHNGKIWVESDGNNGTTFFVELPIN
jgi:signal transduction histidine kinase